MGLDISLYRVDKELINENDFYILASFEKEKSIKSFGEDNIHLKAFKHYQPEKAGFSADKYQPCGSRFFKGNIHFLFYDLTSPLNRIYDAIVDNAYQEINLSEEDCQMLLDYGWYDYVRKHQCTIKYDNVFSVNGKYAELTAFILEKITIEIDSREMPFEEEKEEVLYATEIGWQKGGLNELFYKEYKKKDSYFITDKETMQLIYERYVIKEKKNNFKQNILDKFIEGETFCTFCW